MAFNIQKGIEYSRNLMTVRIAKILGIDEILSLSKKLNIYDEAQSYYPFP